MNVKNYLRMAAQKNLWKEKFNEIYKRGKTWDK